MHTVPGYCICNPGSSLSDVNTHDLSFLRLYLKNCFGWPIGFLCTYFVIVWVFFPSIYFLFFMSAREFQHISSRVESRKCIFHGAQNSLYSSGRMYGNVYFWLRIKNEVTLHYLSILGDTGMLILHRPLSGTSCWWPEELAFHKPEGFNEVVWSLLF